MEKTLLCSSSLSLYHKLKVKALVAPLVLQCYISGKRGEWNGSIIYHGPDGVCPLHGKSVLLFNTQSQLSTSAAASAGGHKSVPSLMSPLHGRNQQCAIIADLYGGVRVDVFVVMEPGEDRMGVSGDGDVENDILTFAHLQVIREVMDHWLIEDFMIGGGGIDFLLANKAITITRSRYCFLWS